MPLLAVPVLLGVTAAASAAAAGVGAAGAISSAHAQASAERYNAQVASNNAGAAAQQSQFNAQQIQDATRRNVATQRAAMAASGFDPNTGSFAAVTADTKRQGEMNKLASIYQGRLGINRSISESQLDTTSASADTTAGLFSAGSTVLGGVDSATKIFSNPVFHSN